jgi:hypothetical protein
VSCRSTTTPSRSAPEMRCRVLLVNARARPRRPSPRRARRSHGGATAGSRRSVEPEPSQTRAVRGIGHRDLRIGRDDDHTRSTSQFASALTRSAAGRPVADRPGRGRRRPARVARTHSRAPRSGNDRSSTSAGCSSSSMTNRGCQPIRARCAAHTVDW